MGRRPIKVKDYFVADDTGIIFLVDPIINGDSSGGYLAMETKTLIPTCVSSIFDSEAVGVSDMTLECFNPNYLFPLIMICDKVILKLTCFQGFVALVAPKRVKQPWCKRLLQWASTLTRFLRVP